MGKGGRRKGIACVESLLLVVKSNIFKRESLEVGICLLSSELVWIYLGRGNGIWILRQTSTILI